jgi:hypothetical protein
MDAAEDDPSFTAAGEKLLRGHELAPGEELLRGRVLEKLRELMTSDPPDTLVVRWRCSPTHFHPCHPTL